MATFFIEPYVKYYNNLASSGGMDVKRKELEDYTTLLVNNIGSLSSFVETSTWKEMGSSEITSSSFPKVAKTLNSLKTDISEYLKQAITSTNTLYSKVSLLKTKDEEYETKKEELSSLKRNEPTHYDENGNTTSSYSSWKRNVENKENDITKLEEECKKLQDESKALVNTINSIKLDEIVEDTPVTTSSGIDTTNYGNTSTWAYDGVNYITANTKISVGDYVKHVAKNQICETKNYAKYNEHCLGFAYVHAYDMYAGITKDDAEDGYHWRHGTNYYDVTSDDKKTILKEIYNEVNKGNTVIVQVNGNKKGTSRHYVTVLGYNSRVKNADEITEDDLITLDSYDGKVKKLGTNGRRFMVTGAACHKKYSGYQIYKLKES